MNTTGDNLLFVIKNFFRNDLVNLTAKSVRHFVPEAHIACLNLFKKSINEYRDQEFLNVNEVFYKQSKYDSKGVGGQGNAQNSLFFSEGYNFIYEKYKDFDGKILMMAEDHFFTSGKTIEEFINKDFDIAYAKWGDGVNGSILGLDNRRPKIKSIFPLPERVAGGVEGVFKEDILDKAAQPHRFSTRDDSDYKGDGLYTNNAQEVRKALTNHNILNQL